MVEVAKEQITYLPQFYAVERERSTEPAELDAMRRHAIVHFEEMGFPTTRDEEWKYTNVAPIASTSFLRAPFEEPQVTLGEVERLVGHAPEHRLVFVDGRISRELSSLERLPAGVQVMPIWEAVQNAWGIVEPYLGHIARHEGRAFTALNLALSEDGAFIHVTRGAVVEEPIHLIFVGTAHQQPIAAHPRILIVAEENSQASVVETYTGQPGAVYFHNAVVEVAASQNAVLDHYKVERESLDAFHVSTTQARLGRDVNYTHTSVSLGGALVRNDLNTVMDDEGITCTLNGLYMVNGRQHVDNHTAIDHAKPHCESHELYKGILDGRATGVFNGKVYVRLDAQKTDARQTNQNLLLSPDAVIDTKPQLEIFADDVRCTHGATVGQMDADALFYLRSRGIGLEEARSLLTLAFASDVIGRIKLAPVRESLERRLFGSLSE